MAPWVFSQALDERHMGTRVLRIYNGQRHLWSQMVLAACGQDLTPPLTQPTPNPHVFWNEVGHVSILSFLRRLGLWMNVHCKLKIHEMQILLCCYHFRKLNLSRRRAQCLWLRSAVHGQCGECQSLSFCEPQLSDLCPSSDVVILEINLTNEIFSLLSLLSGQSYRPVPSGLPRSPMLFQKKIYFQSYTWHNQSLACKMCEIHLQHRSPGRNNPCRCTALLNEGWKEGRESKWF